MFLVWWNGEYEYIVIFMYCNTRISIFKFHLDLFQNFNYFDTDEQRRPSEFFQMVIHSIKIM